jgi:hypothetical protein
MVIDKDILLVTTLGGFFMRGNGRLEFVVLLDDVQGFGW